MIARTFIERTHVDVTVKRTGGECFWLVDVNPVVPKLGSICCIDGKISLVLIVVCAPEGNFGEALFNVGSGENIEGFHTRLTADSCIQTISKNFGNALVCDIQTTVIFKSLAGLSVGASEFCF